MVNQAIQNRQEKIKKNAELMRRERRNLKKARRFQTRLDTLYPGEDELGKAMRRAKKNKPLTVQQAKPAEISRDIINDYKTKEPKRIRDNPNNVEKTHYNKFREAYLDLKKKLEIQLIKDNKQNEILLEPLNTTKHLNVRRDLNQTTSNALVGRYVKMQKQMEQRRAAS